jgi:hypothetical protein
VEVPSISTYLILSFPSHLLLTPESEIATLTENLNSEREIVQVHLAELNSWEDKWAEKEKEIVDKHNSNEDIQEKLKSEISTLHSQLLELRSTIEERGQYSHAPSNESLLRIFDEDSHPGPQFQRPRVPAVTSNSDSVDESISLREILEPEQTTQGLDGEGSGSGTMEEGGTGAVPEVKDPERKRKAAVGAGGGGGGGGKLVLLQQVTVSVLQAVIVTAVRTDPAVQIARSNNIPRNKHFGQSRFLVVSLDLDAKIKAIRVYVVEVYGTIVHLLLATFASLINTSITPFSASTSTSHCTERLRKKCEGMFCLSEKRIAI